MSESNSIPLPTHGNFKDLTGKVFGHLTVISYAGKDDHRKSLWRARCGCSDTIFPGSDIVKNMTPRCECLVKVRKHAQQQKQVLTRGRKGPKAPRHGMANTPEYNSWRAMWERCANPNSEKYPTYQHRTPPPEWRSFATFYAELGPKPTPLHTLDRIDNDKPYGPGNCRWATPVQQGNNTSRNIFVSLAGQTTGLRRACLTVGIPLSTVYARLRKGQDVQQASNGLFLPASN